MIPDKNYEYVNLEYIQDLAYGGDDFLVEIIGVYLNSASINLNGLRAAVQGGDMEKTVFYAHTLKGSSSFFGCTQLEENIVLLEECAQQGTNISLLPGLVEKIIFLSEKITLELKGILDGCKA
jgi:HPt (histidine-containing phosphotransfer) domain-containing protein